MSFPPGAIFSFVFSALFLLSFLPRVNMLSLWQGGMVMSLGADGPHFPLLDVKDNTRWGGYFLLP